MVPNLFTVTNMGLGFYAIVMAINDQWIPFAWAILFAQVMDMLDGRVARWLKKTSQFGMQFDSFADWISFGVAPALGMYLLALKNYGKLGLALAFFYVLCGAIRLTKYNLKAFEKVDEPPNHNFVGLPIPGAGGFLAIMVMLIALFNNDNQGSTFPVIYNLTPYLIKGIPIIVFALALMMVSRLQFQSFKRTHMFRPRSMYSFMVTLITCFLIYAYPSNTIFIIYVTYLLWGLFGTLLRAALIKKKHEEDFAYTGKEL